MNVAELFIKRPVMTTLVMLAILLFGIMGYRSLPVSDLPVVDFPTITVNAGLPGASPETMAAAVAQPLERRFSTINGLDAMTSSSSLGSTSITLQFALDRDIDAAAQDVQSMISQATRDLPRDMPSPPSFRKVNPADSPILFLVLSSPTLRLSDVNEYAETMIAQRLSMVSGVAQVNVMGGQKYAVRVDLDPNALATRRIGIDEVNDAIQNGNVNRPTGVLWGNDQAFTVEANGQLTNAEEYKPLVVAYRNGSPVRLNEVANVYDSVENIRQAAWFNQVRCIMLMIQRQPGTNTVEVVDAIKALLPNFRAQMPPSVKLDIMIDRSESIRDSVNDVKFTLFLALCLVIMVIFLFLRNVSATVIPSLALPMSIVSTFAAMYLLGYSLDNLSLMALTLSVGFVVDDAIVMLENIVRHMEHGEPAMQAALRGSREIGFTIISMTLSLAAVFLPVLFMGGILGRLLHEFAVTIGVAILVSGFVSLSLTPMLCSRWLKPSKEAHHGRFWALSEGIFDGMLHVYDWSLQRVMRHRVAVMAISVIILVATVYLFTIMPTGLLPSEDTGQFSATTEGPQGISFDSMVAHQQAVAEIIRRDPYVESFMSNVGGGNSGRFFIKLKPRDQRPHVDAVIQELRPKLAKVPGIRVYMVNSPPISFGPRMSRSQYQFTLQSPDTAELYSYAPKLEARMRQIPGMQDVNTDMLLANPQVQVNINRDRASALGLTAGQIESALAAAYSQSQISSIYAPNDTYRVVLDVKPEYQLDQNALSLLYVRSNNGALVPLSTVASVYRDIGPMNVNHQGQLPAVTVSFNLAPGAALGDAVAATEQVAREILPSTISTSFQGTAQAFQSSFRGWGVLLIMAIAVIYIVLGILYESFIHPLTILSGLPSAGFGALLTLLVVRKWVPSLDLNLYAFVGIIMLVGIVKKNAIMMIDFALEAQRKQGLPPQEAIFQGALIRFRPIMMTTMAALMGTLPIALGMGAGAESRRPLGIAVVGGLVFSQLLTLYITPVFFTYMESFQQWMRKLRGKEELLPERLPEPVLAGENDEERGFATHA